MLTGVHARNSEIYPKWHPVHVETTRDKNLDYFKSFLHYILVNYATDLQVK